MILIADSGSTKCSWVLCDNQGDVIKEINTIGFNPNLINENSLQLILEESVLTKYKESIKDIFFYGAGCTSDNNNMIIQKPLQKLFCNARVSIKHDLEAACYAMYNGSPNITCILGTGSNSCYYNGQDIKEQSPSLGFLIGDEASGNYFGKEILHLYFNNLMPKELKEKFEEDYEHNLSTIKKNIYNNTRSNAYLASYFPFVSENKEHPSIQVLINKGLDVFFELHICCYKQHKEIEINFIGSVAHYLSNEIKETAKKYGCRIGDIIQKPIYRLIKIHSKRLKDL